MSHFEERTHTLYMSVCLQINGRPLVDITHRDVATLIVTIPSDHVELVVHRPSSAVWLESSHELYLSKQSVTGLRRNEVSWTELQPWMEQQPLKSLVTIKEREENCTEELDELEHGEQLPPQLPDDDPPSVMEEELPSLPEEGPPSLIENELSNHSEDMLPELSLSEENKSKAHGNERTTTAATKRLHFQKQTSVAEDTSLLTKEEPSLICEEECHLSPEGELSILPEGELPPPPQGEPPLDESNDELSWEQEQSPDHGPTHPEHDLSKQGHLRPHHASHTCNDDKLTAIAAEQTGSTVATANPGFTNGQPTISGHMTKRSSIPSISGSTEDENFQLSNSFDEVDKSIFTVILKKGFRGLGFMLDKQRSLAEGECTVLMVILH